DLYERPCNAFVAQFIGENNRLIGRVLNVRDNRCFVATESGSTLEALVVNIGPPGSRTTLSIRPEHVMLNPEVAACENTLEAKVLEQTYHGDHTRISLEVPGWSEFLVKVPNAKGRFRARPGQIVRIGWRGSDCLALDAPIAVIE